MVEAYMDSVTKLSRQLLSVLAVSLDLAPNY